MPPVHFSKATVDELVKCVYGEAVIKRVYGEGTEIGLWNQKGVRRLRLRLETPPGALFIRTANVGATLTQTVVLSDHARCHEVRGDIRLHVPFSRCIKIAEVQGKQGAEMRASVDLHAVVPPPLNRILEDVMARTTTSCEKKNVWCLKVGFSLHAKPTLQTKMPG